MSIRRILVILVSVVIVASMAISLSPGQRAIAAETSDGWTNIAAGGLGSAANVWAWPSADFRGELYLTQPPPPSPTAAPLWAYNGSKFRRAARNGFGDSNNIAAFPTVVFNGYLYCGTQNQVTGGELWRSANGSNWAQVGKNGFGSAQNTCCMPLGVVDGAVFVAFYNFNGVRVFRSSNGTAWTQANYDGFGKGYRETSFGAVYRGELYVAGCSNLSPSDAKSQVFRYRGGRTWQSVSTVDFGDPNNRDVRSLYADSERLAAAVPNNETGVEIWVFDGVQWDQVGSDGMGDKRYNGGSALLYGGRLYVGTAAIRETGAPPGKLFREKDGGGFETLVANGFGDRHNIGIFMTRVWRGAFYAGTANMNGFEVWRTPLSTDTWYLAEGSTAWGFSEYISIQNPNASEVTVDITYNTTRNGAVSGGTRTLPASSQTTINPADILGQQDFSTKVECKTGDSIAVDRTMEWTGPGAASPEAHNSVGVTAPATTWYLPEGSSAWGFECWLLIQNPGGRTANCTLTYMIEGVGPQEVQVQVPAGSRGTWNMADQIGSKDASVQVTSDVPIIPERAMYRNNRREGHDSIGTTAAAADFFLAEGATGYNVGFITYVLVQNPQDSATDVQITYQTASGEVAGPAFQMPAQTRKTIRVNDQLGPNTDVSTKVHGSQEIIAERAMYWVSGSGEACHDSIGMSEAHMSFYLPDGETSNGRETWTLVQNPNAEDVTVTITYMTPDGTGNVSFDELIPAVSRRTFNMADKGIAGRAAVMVVSGTDGKPVMVERAMYWNSRGAGTDTIGGFSD